MSNNVDLDEMVHNSHLDLGCLQKPIVITYGSERVIWETLPAYHTCSKIS